MDDVDRRAQLAAQAQQQRHGLALPGRRARREVGRVAARVARRLRERPSPARRGRAAACRARRGSAAPRAARPRRPPGSRRCRSGTGSLDAAGAGVEQRARARRRCRARGRPRSRSRRARARPRRRACAASASRVVVSGTAVERHVDERRDAARGRGARRALEALPLGAAGLVDVDVAVDEAGQQHRVADVLDRGARPARRPRATTATIRPSRTSTAPARSPSGVTTRRLRRARVDCGRGLVGLAHARWRSQDCNSVRS